MSGEPSHERPALSHSPTVEEVRDRDLGVKFSDFYLLAMNSKTYKMLWAPKRHSSEPDGAPGPLLRVFGPANLTSRGLLTGAPQDTYPGVRKRLTPPLLPGVRAPLLNTRHRTQG